MIYTEMRDPIEKN